MMQLYLLRMILMILGLPMLLCDRYGYRFPQMLGLKELFLRNTIVQKIMIVAPCLTAVLSFIFPADPGPAFLGDFIPCVALILLSIWLYVYSRPESAKTSITMKELSKRLIYSRILTAVIILHLLFPGWVLL